MSLDLLKAVDPLFWVAVIGVCFALLFGFQRLKAHPQFPILIGLRVCSIAVLVFLLMQPVMRWQKQETFPLTWNIYLDNSVSMRYHQSISVPSLTNGVETVEEAIISKTENVSFYQFSRSVEEVSSLAVNAKGSATDLGSVIDDILSDQDALAGAVIITDGQLTQGKHPSSFEKTSIPIHVIAVGDSLPMVDIAVKSLDAPTVAIKGEDVKANVIVQAAGQVDKPVNVSLYQDAKLLGSKRVRVRGGGSEREVSFQFRPKQIGTQEYEVRVSSASEEINIENNRQPFEINILKDRYPVALVTGAPNYHTSLIKKFTKSYPRITLDHFIQRSENVFYPSLDKFWKTSYDLIIFDNFPASGLPKTLQRILGKKIVQNQASLAWIFGPNTSKNTAESLFPFFHIDGINAELKETPKEWYFSENFNIERYLSSVAGQSEFPPLRSADFSMIPNISESEILAQQNSESAHPVILRSDVNGLRSFIFGAPDMHKLHFALQETDNSGFLENFWHGMYNWLLRSGSENELYFRLNKESYQQGEEIHITGTQKGITNQAEARAFVSVFKDNEKMNSSELHYNLSRSRWEGNIWASSPGTYSYEIGVEHGKNTTVHRGEFAVNESQIELNRVFVNRSLLKNLAKQSGGKYIPWSYRADVSDLVMNQSKNVTSKASVKFSQNPWLILVLLFLLCTEWSVRRFSGLP